MPGTMARLSFDERRLFELMRSAGVEVLLASTRHNIRYLTGGYYYPLYLWDAHTRGGQYLSFLAIPRDRPAEAFYVGRPGEREVIEAAETWVPRCHECAAIATRPAAEKTVEVLRETGLEAGRIAVELPSLPADAFQVLQDGLGTAELVDAVPILDALRAVKSAREIQILREATVMNLEAVAVVLRSGREGETTASIARRVEGEARARGLHHLYALVSAGPSYFRMPSEKHRWAAGSLLHIDTGAMQEGYIAEVCRTGFLGSPSPLAERLLRGCEELEQAVLPSLRPGVPANQVQRRGDEFLAAHPLGKHGKFIAHGIGLVHHEDPQIDLRHTQPLEAGMVLSIEMEFRHPDAGHAKIEDMVVVTPSGGERLSPAGEEWYVSGP